MIDPVNQLIALDQVCKQQLSILAEAERVLTLAHDFTEPYEEEQTTCVGASHVNANIRAALAKIRPLLPKPSQPIS